MGSNSCVYMLRNVSKFDNRKIDWSILYHLIVNVIEVHIIRKPRPGDNRGINQNVKSKIIRTKMRITAQVIPLFLLILTLPACLVHQFNFFEVLFILLSLAGIRTILVFHKLSQRAKDKRIILESLTVSHYVEKIRWCLDYIDIPYNEEENS